MPEVVERRDPYAPAGPARMPVSPARTDPLDAFVDRVRRLSHGRMTDEQEQGIRDAWEESDEADRAELRALSDGAIAKELASIDREYEEATLTEDEQFDLDVDRRAVALFTEVPDGTISQVEAWIDGADGDAVELTARRKAALAAETGEGGQGRSTLIEKLERSLVDEEAGAASD